MFGARDKRAGCLASCDLAQQVTRLFLRVGSNFFLFYRGFSAGQQGSLALLCPPGAGRCPRRGTAGHSEAEARRPGAETRVSAAGSKTRVTASGTLGSYAGLPRGGGRARSRCSPRLTEVQRGCRNTRCCAAAPATGSRDAPGAAPSVRGTMSDLFRGPRSSRLSAESYVGSRKPIARCRPEAYRAGWWLGLMARDSEWPLSADRRDKALVASAATGVPCGRARKNT